MDTATTPYSQTGNAESYKKASGLADLQCLDYDPISVLGAKNRNRTVFLSCSWPLQKRYRNIFSRICTKTIVTDYYTSVSRTSNFSS